jgi:hypothetical protein
MKSESSDMAHISPPRLRNHLASESLMHPILRKHCGGHALPLLRPTRDMQEQVKWDNCSALDTEKLGVVTVTAWRWKPFRLYRRAFVESFK